MLTWRLLGNSARSFHAGNEWWELDRLTTFPKPLDSSEASTMRGHVAARISSNLDAKTDQFGWLQALETI
jgi:hypothetical protein